VDVLVSKVDMGWVGMNIIAQSTSSGTTQGAILARYVHDTSIIFGISMTIGAYTLSPSSSGSYDEKAFSNNWYY